jgi:DNA (cytosine-5)-methyltransferase 1
VSRPSFASLFGGFRGVDIGAQAAGYELAWSLEYDPALAEVGAQLPGKVHVLDVLDADPRRFERVDVLHASPPCPNFSVAKTGRGETAQDQALAAKVAEFVTVLRPRVFTLENVYAYRLSESWASIENALHAAGYWFHLAHANAADFAVPQTRRRMIVRAVLGGWVPHLPEPEPWVGWYQAIEDLIPTLPESKFAEWQLARLPETMTMNGIRAFLVFDGMRMDDEPAQTICANRLGSKAFLVNTREGHHGGNPAAVMDDEPIYTLPATSSPARHKAWLSAGRVVSMTPRALARLQSFPDWYELPDKKSLAYKGIGNACPPLEFEKIYRKFVVDGVIPVAAQDFFAPVSRDRDADYGGLNETYRCFRSPERC